MVRFSFLPSLFEVIISELDFRELANGGMNDG